MGGCWGGQVDGNSNPSKYAETPATPWPMNNNGPPGNTALPVRNRAVEITTTLTTSYILKNEKKKKRCAAVAAAQERRR